MPSMSQAPSPKRSATIFLQVVVVLIGIGALALMLWEPHLEGRNAHATPFEIYFKDPFLAYAYLASLAFFVASFKRSGCSDTSGKTTSSHSVRSELCGRSNTA